jgi:pimeloyl-ACP methyl ester carboxylesterase
VLGAGSASIQALYEARARGDVSGFTVPAINLRAQTFDMARTVYEAASAAGVGAVILELARSEQTYTFQRPIDYATSVLAGAIAAGWQGPVFIQGDHYQFNAKKYAADPEAIPALLTRPPDGKEGFVDFVLGAWKVIGSPGFAADEGALRARAAASYDRGIYPDGTGRQLLAIVASGDRTEALRELDVPTTVIHGTDDILVDVSGGKATAAAIPGARLELIEGMGHDLPAQLWPRFVELITEAAARAQARTAG